MYIRYVMLQRQGEEDGAGGALHLPAGPSHPQHQGRALHPDHHTPEAGTASAQKPFFFSIKIFVQR